MHARGVVSSRAFVVPYGESSPVRIYGVSTMLKIDVGVALSIYLLNIIRGGSFDAFIDVCFSHYCIHGCQLVFFRFIIFLR